MRRRKDSIDEKDSRTREQIFEYIENNPGVHLRKISRELGLALGNTQYHLQILENAGRIKTRRATLYKHYYPAAILDESHELILSFLRQESSRDILILLLEHSGGLTQTEIVDFKHLSAPTISWHMSKLVESGLVVSVREGRTVRYTVKKDLIKGTIYLLKAYHPTTLNKLAGRLSDLFLELSSIDPNNTPNRKEDDANGTVDK